MKPKRLAVVVVLTFVGCATLSPQAQAVRVTTNPDVVKGCRYIGEVRGEGAIHFYEGAGDDWQRATADIKNNASKVGANVVFLTSLRETANQVGEAYSCPAQPQ